MMTSILRSGTAGRGKLPSAKFSSDISCKKGASPLLCFFFLPAFCGGGCGQSSCKQDTDCKIPLICIAGTCTNKYTDGNIDVRIEPDGAVNNEPAADTSDPDYGAEIEAQEPQMESEDSAIFEDSEEELPPATIIWSENFSEGATRWEVQQGAWQVVDGQYQQSDNVFSEAWVPTESWTDYAAEVSIIVNEYDSAWPLAVMGLMFRVVEINPNNKYYLCGADFDNNKLILMRYDQISGPGYYELCELSSIDPPLAVQEIYRLQVVARGFELKCRLASGDGVSTIAQVSATDNQSLYPGGSIGLFAYRISGRFDDVTVYDHQPPQWPAPQTQITCP